MNKIILLALSVLLLSGCFSQSLEEQRTSCLNEGKKFYTKKFLNMRTGEYEIRGECK